MERRCVDNSAAIVDGESQISYSALVQPKFRTNASERLLGADIDCAAGAQHDTNLRYHSPLTSITPHFAGKIIVKMGLFDTIPKAVAELYCRNKQSWEPDFGIPALQGAS